uniref:Uncharacterized protein n=1 Tax=Arundo donax TaxID=35708 RepID=A0A0A9CZ84_ARUDO
MSSSITASIPPRSANLGPFSPLTTPSATGASGLASPPPPPSDVMRRRAFSAVTSISSCWLVLGFRLGVWEAYWERSMDLVTSKAGGGGEWAAWSETDVEEEVLAWASLRRRRRREAADSSSSEPEDEGGGREDRTRRTAVMKGSNFWRRSSGWWMRRVLATSSAEEPETARPPSRMRRRSFHSKDAIWHRPAIP